MKKHIQITFVERCYFCPNMQVNREHTNDCMRTFICMELERVIDKAALFLGPKRKSKKIPLLGKEDWFPEWCPLEEIEK